MTLADARALVPDVATLPDDPERTAAMLRGLSRWAGRYTPHGAVDGADALLLDVTGCAHLFGGEATLLDDLGARLARMGLTARVGLTDTRRAAWAWARFGKGGVVAPGGTRQALDGLPVAALGIDAETVATLMRLGLRRIGQLVPMPRAGLARRFGRDLTQRLDRALGIDPDPIPRAEAHRPFAVRLSLPDPVGRTEDVMAALDRLLERLCTRLERERRGARELAFQARRVDRGTQTVRIVLARPGRDGAAIARLFARHVDDLDAGFGIDALRLEAVTTEPLDLAQPALATVRDREHPFDDLIASLSNRLGHDRVLRYLPADSHVPERCFTVAPALYAPPESFPEEVPLRPLTLFDPEAVVVEAGGSPPRAFRWRRMRLETARATGPERIAPEWWWDDPAWRSGVRDYWWVQTVQGRRLWLFCNPQKGTDWFVHGEFA